MYTYQLNDRKKYEVIKEGRFICEFPTEAEAAAACMTLNGQDWPAEEILKREG